MSLPDPRADARLDSSLTVLVLAFVLLLPRSVSGEEDGGKLAINFASSRGLTGMRDLIDARVPEEDVAARATLTYSYARTGVDSPAFSRVVERHYSELALGCAFLGVLDLGMRIEPFEYRLTNGRVQDGFADLDLGAKLSWTTDVGALAPYVTQELATSSRSLAHTYVTEVGGAGTLALLDQLLTFHTNLAFVDRNAGKLAFRYRFGVAGLPFATTDFVLRLFGYLDGLEYEGTPGSLVTIAGGFQARILAVVSLAVSADGVVHDGTLPRGARDTGSFRAHAGIGVRFAF